MLFEKAVVLIVYTNWENNDNPTYKGEPKCIKMWEKVKELEEILLKMRQIDTTYTNRRNTV